MKRPADITRDDRAGCTICYGNETQWVSRNAQALAAKHSDRTGHQTWFTLSLRVVYRLAAADDRQMDIEAAIAASSGGASQCAPLTVFDASADTAADVSAPAGRSSKPALAAAPPESVSS